MNKSAFTWQNWSRNLGIALRWSMVILAYAYLTYKLIHFQDYAVLAEKWTSLALSKLAWMLAASALLPLNWMLEARKWQKLTLHFQELNYSQALKGVLAGIASGFFTPNRIGEFVGRNLYLDKEQAAAGLSMSIVNSFTQNIVMALFGIPAAWIYFAAISQTYSPTNTDFLYAIGFGSLIAGGLYLWIPTISKWLSSIKALNFLSRILNIFISYSKIELLHIIGLSVIRYIVFCAQFYFMLLFWDVNLTVGQALIAIPVSYLFVTFTPSVAFSEAAIRSSYAVLFIGAFSTNVMGIALAGVSIWVVNFVLPMLVGSVMMIGIKR